MTFGAMGCTQSSWNSKTHTSSIWEWQSVIFNLMSSQTCHWYYWQTFAKLNVMAHITSKQCKKSRSTRQTEMEVEAKIQEASQALHDKKYETMAAAACNFGVPYDQFVLDIRNIPNHAQLHMQINNSLHFLRKISCATGWNILGEKGSLCQRRWCCLLQPQTWAKAFEKSWRKKESHAYQIQSGFMHSWTITQISSWSSQLAWTLLMPSPSASTPLLSRPLWAPWQFPAR